jgi:prophage regulatory protein
MQDQQAASLYTIRTVQAITALGRTKIYDLIRKGDFPAPIKLGARTSRWPAAVIEAWVKAQIDAHASV